MKTKKDDLIEIYFQKSQIFRKPEDFPEKPGVYLISIEDKQTKPIYLGRAENLKKRWKNHHKDTNLVLLKELGHKLEYRAIIIEPYLLKLSPSILGNVEKNLIKAFEPYLNVIKY